MFTPTRIQGGGVNKEEKSGRVMARFQFVGFVGRNTVNTIKLETGLRQNSAGTPYTLLLRIEDIVFPTFGL